MKYIITLLFCLIFSFVNAQNTSTNISNIQPISTAEFNSIQSPKNGDIVLIKETATLMYYVNNTWFAMQGECTPKPNTPKIDSVTTTETTIVIYFTPTVQKQQYELQILDTDIKATVSKSPAQLPIPKEKSVYVLQIQAITPCGKAGPMATVINLQK
ncbi:MAG: hypothetical protein H6553_02045 [Chitinophagales bacterium]|nr:hypothetical protein [Chitinophagales bacterium]